MMIAGENSGDLHGSRLIECLLRDRPDLEIFGFGGERMRAAGMELLDDVASRLPIMGFTQVIKNLGLIRELFRLSESLMRERQPDLLVVIDYPGFNLRAARQAKGFNIPVVYYIAPQVWAWHKSRINLIRRYIDKVLVILPFEREFYQKAGIEVEFVGHPLQDDYEVLMPGNLVREKYGLKSDSKVVGLIPGSRTGEVVCHLPFILEAAEKIREQIPDVNFVLPRAGTVTSKMLENYIVRFPGLSVTVYEEDFASMRGVMDFAICKSGTSTLEMALSKVPMVVLYKTSWFTAFVALKILRLKRISLVNIVANENVVTELLQHDANPKAIAGEALKYLRNDTSSNRMKKKLEAVSALLGEGGASQRAANAVLQMLDKSRLL